MNELPAFRCISPQDRLLFPHALERQPNFFKREDTVPKYLIEAAYKPEGVKGLLAEGGSKRREAATKAIKAAGGKVEAFYFAFGSSDAVVIVDLPDHVSAAAVALVINASGAVTVRTTVLLTPAEIDEAVKKAVPYRAPGE